LLTVFPMVLMVISFCFSFLINFPEQEIVPEVPELTMGPAAR
jgi:hypothetical protein